MAQCNSAVVTTEVRLIGTRNGEVAKLGKVVAGPFGRYREAEIYSSQPGLGVILAARILAEFTDDSTRFADAKARKNYAGISPIARASGTRKNVLGPLRTEHSSRRRGQHWAFGWLNPSPGARAYYHSLRARNIGHQAALRQLAFASSASCTAA